MVCYKCPACSSSDSTDLQSISHSIEKHDSAGRASASQKKIFLLPNTKKKRERERESKVIYSQGDFHTECRGCTVTVHLCLIQTVSLRRPRITKIVIHRQMFLWLSSTQPLPACAFMNIIYIVKRFSSPVPRSYVSTEFF